MAEARPGTTHIEFIDWFKCIGILLILYGHLAGWAPLAALPPIYTKQLGVALFLFVAGYSLARETRNRWQVAFNRLFEVFLLGLATALVMSAVTFATEGRLQLSNYAPLAGGINVIFNFFPANPTTWFLGTYFHVIALWTLIGHRVKVSPAILALSLLTEVGVRVILMETAGPFVAYMALPNWLTVILLGYWYGQRSGSGSLNLPHSRASLVAAFLLASIAVWSAAASFLPFRQTFPFMQLGANGLIEHIAVSVLVSVVYLAATWLTFMSVVRLRAPGPVRFVAAHTLVIFLAHMPVYYALQPRLMAWGLSRLAASVTLMVVCLAGLGWLSRVLHSGGRIRKMRDGAFGRLRFLHVGQAAGRS